MNNVIRPSFRKAHTEVDEVRRFYGETRTHRVGLVACPAEPYGATLKVVMGPSDGEDLEAVAVVLDGPGAEAEADRIGIAVLRALQKAER
jgi:hypothetical protein